MLLRTAALVACSSLLRPMALQAAQEDKPTGGHPTIVLDQLEFPKDVLGSSKFEKHLRRTLRREARRVDWGAGRDNRIEYRFSVTTLRFELEDELLRVHCTAVGRLPGGRSAKSRISFGGAPSERSRLVQDVLDVVARGVMTRLAELERQRRGLR